MGHIKEVIMMKQKNKGMTLIEVIIALAIFGILSIGLLTPVVAQYGILNRTKNITVDAFDIQDAVEDKIYDVRNVLKSGSTPIVDVAKDKKDSVGTVNFNGHMVEMYKIDMEFEDYGTRAVSVLLSKELAKNQNFLKVKVDSVWIDIKDDVNDIIVDSSVSKIEALIEEKVDPNRFTKLYKWYVSKEGITEPKSIDDYYQISIERAPLDKAELKDLEEFANKFVIVSATPVDIHGRRGDEVFSSNRVFVRGQEWRAGSFAWMDTDKDGIYEPDDYMLISHQKLLELFDTDRFIIKHPSEGEKEIKLSGGYLFIPQFLSEDGNPFYINAAGTAKIDWSAINGIHLANDIASTSSSDIRLSTKDGNIVLFRFVLIEGGNVKKDSNGLSILDNRGSSLTSDKNIYLTAGGKGNILLQRFSSLKGDNVILSANGKVEVFESSFFAENSIDIDTTQAIDVLTVRDIKLDKTEVEIKNSSAANKYIKLNSRDNINLIESQITGNKSAVSFADFKAKEKINLQKMIFDNITVLLNSDTVFAGGEWDHSSEMIIKDKKSITFKKDASGNKVNNEGSIISGDIGKLIFDADLKDILKNEIKLELERQASNAVRIINDYGRNTAYADPKSESVSLSGVYQDLGQGNVNLEYTVNKTASDIPGIEDIIYTFDGNDTLSISAIASGIADDTVTLTIRDKYTQPQITATKTIRITSTSETGGPASVEVVD